MSIERYNRLSRPGEFSLTLAHFERDRFLDVHETDTHYTDLSKMNAPLLDRIPSEWDSARYIGDKKPQYYLVYDQLFKAFPGARIVFIYREPVAVASSYEKRFRSGKNWRPKADHRFAVDDWNESIALTLSAMDRHPGRILPIDFDSAFMRDTPLEPLASFLELDDLDLAAGEPAESRNKAIDLEQTREQLLSPEQIKWVLKNVDKRRLEAIDAQNPFLPENQGQQLSAPRRRRFGSLFR
jgi:hypothetical protein